MQRVVLRHALLYIPKRAIPAASIPCAPVILPRYASKKAGKKARIQQNKEEDMETVVIQTKGKGKGKQRASEETITDQSLPGEKFSLAALEFNMQNSIERLRVALKPVVGRVGRISPDILEPVRVEIDGEMSRLSDYASVSVIDGTRMKVNLYDPSVRVDVCG